MSRPRKFTFSFTCSARSSIFGFLFSKGWYFMAVIVQISLTSSQKGLITYNRKKVFASAFQFNSNTKGRMILQAVIWRLFTSTFVWLFLTCMQINIRTLVQFWTARYAFGVYFNYNTWNLQLAYNLWQNNHFQFNLLFKTICHDNTSLDAEDFTFKKTLALLFFEYFSRCHRHSYHQ